VYCGLTTKRDGGMCIVVSQLEGWGDVYCGLTTRGMGGCVLWSHK